METTEVKNPLEILRLDKFLEALDDENEDDFLKKLEKAKKATTARIDPNLDAGAKVKQQEEINRAADQLRTKEGREKAKADLLSKKQEQQNTKMVHPAKNPSLLNPKVQNFYTPNMKTFQKRVEKEYPGVKMTQEKSGSLRIQSKDQKSKDQNQINDFIKKMQAEGSKVLYDNRSEANNVRKEQIKAKKEKAQEKAKSGQSLKK